MSMMLTGVPVLIVEDEPAICQLLQDAVRGCDAVVVGPALRVQQAMMILASRLVSVAILDLLVHDESCERIAEELVRRGIPFAVTTGIGADLRNPLLFGAITITKPFQARHVQDVLAGLLNR